MRKKYAPEHVMIRDGVYYYVRHIPYDLAPIYSVTRLCFSLKTKSLKAAIRPMGIKDGLNAIENILGND